MIQAQQKSLLTRFQLGDITLPNRIIMASMYNWLISDRHHILTISTATCP
jgi:2,4-dienoyl-CoA reductase-like NADH-dependent reductase (Old Yellow Enzyme family)